MLSDTLTRIDALKAELDALQPLKPEHEQRLWQKLRLEWNYNSNHIEGNTLTYGETFLLLIHGQTNGGHSMREFEEMKAHDVAISMVKDWAQDQDRSLTENDVRSLNEVLLKEPFWKEAITADGQPTRMEVVPGRYKKTGNIVRQPDGSLFHYASPEEVQGMMQDLMAWYSSSSGLHPVQKAAVLHHRFIVIHPFGDGNGRTARLLVNYHLMRHGLMPLVVKSADKSNYLRCLKLADAGDMMPFAEYLADAEVWALELAIKAAKGEALDEQSDWTKRAEILFKQADGEQRSDKEREDQWRAKVAGWLDSNFDELANQARSKVLVFDRFFASTSHTFLIQLAPPARPYQPKLERLRKAEVLDMWMTKGMTTLSVHLVLKKYKFKGAVRDRSVTFSLNFEPDRVRFHWYGPEKVDEFVSYDQYLVEYSLQGLDRAAAWIHEDIEKAQKG